MTHLVPLHENPSGGDRWGQAPGPSRSPLEREDVPVDLRRVLVDLRRRWWLMVLVTLLTGIVAWYQVRHRPNVYSASAVVQLVDSRDALTGGLVKENSDRAQAGYGTLSQVEIIGSRAVANIVTDSEPLGLRVEAAGFPDSILSSVTVDGGVSEVRIPVTLTTVGVVVGSASREAVPYGALIHSSGVHFAVTRPAGENVQGAVVVRSRDDAVDDFLFHLDVAGRKQTNLIDIRYTASDPVTAQRVVNRVARVYQEINTRMAQQQLFRRRVFIQDQLARTDAQLAEADRALSTFRNRQQAYNSQEKFKFQQNALVGLDIRRQELDGDRKMARSLVQNFETGNAAQRKSALSMLASAPEIGGDRSTVPDLYRKLVEYERSRSELTSGPSGKADTHPDVVRLDSLIASAEEDLISAAKSHVALLDARIAALDEVRGNDARALGQLPAAEAAETRLQQNSDALREQGATLRTEYQQARIAEAAEVGQVEIVDLATRAQLERANGGRYVLFALFLGLLAGAGLALLLESADHSVKRRDDVEMSLHVPVLGTIPRIDAKETRAARFPTLPSFVHRRLTNGAANGVAITAVAQAGSPASEAFRHLGTSLMYSRGADSARRILVTSPTPGDGKTSIAANLAITLAHQRHRVLLVDCDVYGKVHNLFQLSSSPGVSEVILDGVSPSEVLRPSGVPGLSVMTSGRRPERASDVIGSDRMRAMLNDMSKDFDLLVLDCSPILALADSTILSVSSDTVLLVVRAGRTAATAAVEAMRHLSAVGARVAGIVLNDPEERARAYGVYYYGYGSEIAGR